MSQALYRKWRPARFDQVVGQDHVTITLKNAVAADRLGHAYLFSGPRGTGKTTIARLVAKAANCHDEDLTQRPCDRCPPCLAVNQGRYMDLIEIDAASNTGVDDIRDLREKINFAPSEGRLKVYIIDEVHMLSAAAFNALLKTLEEPPDHAMFVLATTEEHKVPLTIKSRCQLFNFRLLTGSLRDAESLLDQLVAAPGDKITLERAQTVLGTASNEVVSALADAMIGGDGPEGLSIIHQALATGTEARQFSRQMVSYLRHLLLIATAGHELPFNLTEDQAIVMNRQAKRADRAFLIEAVKGFNTAAHIPTGSWQPQLPLELAFIELLPESPFPAVAAPKIEPSDEVKTLPDMEDVSESKTLTVEPTTDTPELEKDVKAVEAPAAFSLDSIKSAWPELRERIGKRDPNLPALVASCKPLATEGDVVVLGFDYPILKDKFEHKKEAKSIVGSELSQLLNSTVSVRTVVTDQYTPPPSQENIDIDDFSALAQELGGVVHK